MMAQSLAPLLISQINEYRLLRVPPVDSLPTSSAMSTRNLRRYAQGKESVSSLLYRQQDSYIYVHLSTQDAGGIGCIYVV